MKRKSSTVKKKKATQPKTADQQHAEKEAVHKEKEKKVEEKKTKAVEADQEVTTDWQAKHDEINDKYLRLYSEFDNYRKRTIKERLDMAKFASEEVIVELLPILDDFERAIKSTEEVKECDPVKEGMKLIFNKFSATLTKKGLKPIEAIGQDFDTDFHEAITYIPASSEDQKGKIVDEIEKGYLLNEKVIRYAKVVIGQ
ncbi:MAG: nucleotide exchange factor GrpE [Bacteroidetes bacterium]|nr:nucleotide exchange factor GrpE [Bacteroidota bacterium]